jgi:hypothetical protein
MYRPCSYTESRQVLLYCNNILMRILQISEHNRVSFSGPIFIQSVGRFHCTNAAVSWEYWRCMSIAGFHVSALLLYSRLAGFQIICIWSRQKVRQDGELWPCPRTSRWSIHTRGVSLTLSLLCPHTYAIYCGIAVRLFFVRYWSPHSSVGIAMDYCLDDRGSLPSRGKRFFLLWKVQTGYGAHPAPYPMGSWGFFPGGRAVWAWSWQLTSVYFWGTQLCRYTSTPPHAFMTWCLIN